MVREGRGMASNARSKPQETGETVTGSEETGGSFRTRGKPEGGAIWGMLGYLEGSSDAS